MKRLIAPLAWLAALALPGVASAQGFQVVVNASNGPSSLSKGQVSGMFLKKQTRWADGRSVKPADQAPADAVRRRFSKVVHGKSVDAVKSYWRKRLFSGRGSPPPELTSDRNILEFVRRNPGGIGYVSAGVALGDGVKAVRIR